MLYQVSRNGQTYGPYTLDDLKRYTASGNVLPTDLIKSDEMAEWIPVSQLLSSETSSAQSVAPPLAAPAQPYAAQPYAPGGTAALAQSPYPDPPALNWGLVLLFDVLTCGLFQYVWNLVIAAWTRRVQPNSTALFYYIGIIALGVLSILLNLVFNLHNAFGTGIFRPGMGAYGGFNLLHMPGLLPRISLGLIAWIVKLIARFQLRESLLEHFNGPEPLGLQLSGVLTFFFGGLYFQYHLNRINQIKQAARYGAPR